MGHGAYEPIVLSKDVLHIPAAAPELLLDVQRSRAKRGAEQGSLALHVQCLTPPERPEPLCFHEVLSEKQGELDSRLLMHGSPKDHVQGGATSFADTSLSLASPTEKILNLNAK